MLPGEDAEVQVVNNGNGDYTLNFSIPEGPTGPANGLNAYGGLYSTGATTLSSTSSGTPETIQMNTELPALNVTTNTGAYSITIPSDGNYSITYNAVINLTTAGASTFSIRTGGSDVPGSTLNVTPQTSQDMDVSYSFIATLNENDELTFAVEGNGLDGQVKQASVEVLKLN